MKQRISSPHEPCYRPTPRQHRCCNCDVYQTIGFWWGNCKGRVKGDLQAVPHRVDHSGVEGCVCFGQRKTNRHSYGGWEGLATDTPE